MLPSNSGLFKLRFRRAVTNKITKIAASVTDDSWDNIGETNLKVVLSGLTFIREWPRLGTKTSVTDENYRQRILGKSYLVHYYINDAKKIVYLLTLRHPRQKPISFGTLRKYKKEMEKQEEEHENEG